MSISGIGLTSTASIFASARQNVTSIATTTTTDAAKSTGTTEKTTTAASDPTERFKDYMSKTPEQRYIESWLKSHGISAEDFAAMSPEDKQAIIDQMKLEMQAKMEEKAAASVDILA